MIPEASPEGIVFKVSAPEATSVYLAGDFNSWAENTDAKISNDKYKLDGPDGEGVFKKTVAVPPGQHQLKFVINGDSDKWFAPDWALETDQEGNAIFYVTESGQPLLRTDVNPDWKPTVSEGVATFRVYRPKAESVYLAGDFNNWANNQNGTVSEPAFAMEGPDDQGVWKAEAPLTPGRHTYKFIVNGTLWEADPNAAEKDEEGHSVINVQ